MRTDVTTFTAWVCTRSSLSPLELVYRTATWAPTAARALAPKCASDPRHPRSGQATASAPCSRRRVASSPSRVRGRLRKRRGAGGRQGRPSRRSDLVSEDEPSPIRIQALQLRPFECLCSLKTQVRHVSACETRSLSHSSLLLLGRKRSAVTQPGPVSGARDLQVEVLLDGFPAASDGRGLRPFGKWGQSTGHVPYRGQGSQVSVVRQAPTQ